LIVFISGPIPTQPAVVYDGTVNIFNYSSNFCPNFTIYSSIEDLISEAKNS